MNPWQKIKGAGRAVLRALEEGGVTFRSWQSATLWIFVTLLMVLLTMKDVGLLFETYYEDPTSTQVSIHEMETIRFEPTLCLKIDPVKMACPLVNAHNGTEVRELLSSFDSISNIIDYIDGISPETTLPDGSMTYNMSKLRAEFHEVTPRDKALLALSNLLILKLTQAESLRDLYPDKFYQWNSIGTFLTYKFYRERGVALVDLIKSVGAYLCRMIELEYTAYNWNRTAGVLLRWYPCDRESISWLGAGSIGYQKTYLCVKNMTPPLYSFNTTMDYTYFIMNPYSLYDNRPGPCQLRANEGEQCRLDLGGDITLSVDTDSNLVLPYNIDMLAFIDIQAQYNLLNVKKRPCNENGPSKFHCRAQCRINAFIRECGCLPLSYFKMHQSIGLSQKLPVCADIPLPANYSFEDKIPQLSNPGCSLVHQHFDPDPECFRNCFQKCRVVKYSFDVRSFPIKERQLTHLTLYVNNYTFPVFQEVLVMDWVNLISSLGGVIGVYAGASFLSLFGFVLVTLERIACRWGQLKSRKSPKPPGSESTNNIGAPAIISRSFGGKGKGSDDIQKKSAPTVYPENGIPYNRRHSPSEQPLQAGVGQIDALGKISEMQLELNQLKMEMEQPQRISTLHLPTDPNSYCLKL